MNAQACRVLLLAVLLGFMTGGKAFAAGEPAASNQDATATDGRVNHIVNVLKFVRWPENAPQSHNFVFCVLGDNPFGRELEKLSGRAVDSRNIRLISDISPQFARYCHAVFIGVSEAGRLPELLAAFTGNPLLTISEIKGFTAAGGMVELHPLPQGKVSLQVNQQSAEAQGLRISAKLLTLSK